MTTPNPTPTPREREAARDTLDKIVEFWEAGRPSTYAPWLEHELIEMSDYIAAALARERREALTEAARLTCWACANYVQYVDGMHQHPHTGEWVNCNAIAINRELIRSSEK